MKLLERYVFRKMALAFGLAFPGLSLTIWLTQSLRQVDLITERGQGVEIFLKISALIFPSLVMVIAPVTVMIAVIFTLHALNQESELSSINAGGASRLVLLKPVLALSLLVTAAVAGCTLYLTPLSAKAGRDLITVANAGVMSSVIREGQFRQLGDGFTIHVRERASNGILLGLFVFDARDPTQTLTYLAEQAALVDNPLGKFLLLQNGVIQRRTTETGEVAVIEFQSYAFDLATLAGRMTTDDYRPRERSTLYLLSPSPEDNYFIWRPYSFLAELHDRFTAPLYVLVFALIPLSLLGQPRTTRQSTSMLIGLAVAEVLALRGLGYIIHGMAGNSPAVYPLMYAIPLLSIAVAIGVIVAGINVRVPNWLVSAVEWPVRVASRWRGNSAAAGE